MPFCTSCGSVLLQDARFCGDCGNSIAVAVGTPTAQPSPKNIESAEFQMAMMALKGNRAEEAEARFNDLLLSENTPPIWCGLALAKAMLILGERSTVEEVTYCLRQAIALDPTERQTIEALYAEVTLKLMTDLATFCQASYNQARAATMKMVLGGATMGVGALVGLSKRDTLFTNVAGIAGVTGGAAAIFSASSQIGDIKFGYERGLQLYNELYYACRAFLSAHGEPARLFEQQAVQLKQSIQCISGRKADSGTPLLVFGILSLLLLCLGPFVALPTLIISLVHLRQINDGLRDETGRNKTIAAIVLSGLALAIFAMALLGGTASSLSRL